MAGRVIPRDSIGREHWVGGDGWGKVQKRLQFDLMDYI